MPRTPRWSRPPRTPVLVGQVTAVAGLVAMGTACGVVAPKGDTGEDTAYFAPGTSPGTYETTGTTVGDTDYSPPGTVATYPTGTGAYVDTSTVGHDSGPGSDTAADADTGMDTASTTYPTAPGDWETSPSAPTRPPALAPLPTPTSKPR